MRWIILAGAALAVSACNGNKAGDEANQANATAADTMGIGDNAGMETNATGSVNAAVANGAIDANTQALMQKDANTHDADTNLANGI